MRAFPWAQRRTPIASLSDRSGRAGESGAAGRLNPISFQRWRLAKRFSVLLAAFALLFSGTVSAQETPVSSDDVPQPVPVLFDDPGRVLTARESAALMADALNLPDKGWQGLFSDVEQGSDQAGVIEALALQGVVKGFLDGTFQPDEPITRGRFATWLAQGFLAGGFVTEPAPFTDIPDGANYAGAAQQLYETGITLGCSADPLMFCGEDGLTLLEAQTLLERALALPYLVSDCQDPGRWLLLCEVFEYIDTDYVFDVTTEEMVAPISDAVELIKAEAGEEGPKRKQFVCSIPDPLFEPACGLARIVPDASLTQVAESVVREVIKGLDPNSAYHDPEEWQAIEEAGRYVGIGVRVVTVDENWQPGCSPLSDTCRILVLTVFEGGPAHKAGIQRGDFIVAVDGEPVDGMTLAEAAQIIRGELDTVVDITIVRHDIDHRLTLTRQEIIVPYTSAASHNTESIAYIELTSFSSYPGGAVEEFRERLAEVGDVDLLVLDLRNNGGGSVAVLQGIAGAFVGEAPVMTFHTVEESYDRHGVGTPLVSDESPRMAVLVNGFSASASEVLAGLLHETGRATVIGETTYKKNTGQSLFDLHNNGVFRLTTIRWTTPGGIDIGDNGVPLDIEIEFPNTDLQGLMEWVKSILDNPPEPTPEEPEGPPEDSEETPGQ